MTEIILGQKKVSYV